MKKILVSLSFLFLLTLSFAQLNEVSFDVVILKNKSEFKGQIIEYVVGSHVIIQTSLEKPLNFPLTEVLRVIQASDIIIAKEKIPFDNEKLYYHVELSTVVSSESDFGYDLSFSAIKQYNAHLGLGGGVAYIDYGHLYQNLERLAIYGSYRLFLHHSNNAPYMQLNAGYAFSLDENNESQTHFNSGLLINPQFGIRFGSSQLMYTIHIGAQFHRTKTDRFENPWGSWQQKLTLKRTELGFGLLF